MTLALASAMRPKRDLSWGLAWAIGLALAAGLFLLRDQLPWAASYPKAWIIPVASWVNAAVPPVVDFLFTTTRAITAVLSLPLQLALGLLSRGFQLGDGDSALAIPRLSWLGLTAAAAIAGHALGGRGLALGTGLCFLYLALFGQWDSAMTTLALIVVAVPIGVASGFSSGSSAIAIRASAVPSSSRCWTSPRRRRSSPISSRC